MACMACMCVDSDKLTAFLVGFFMALEFRSNGLYWFRRQGREEQNPDDYLNYQS